MFQCTFNGPNALPSHSLSFPFLPPCSVIDGFPFLFISSPSFRPVPPLRLLLYPLLHSRSFSVLHFDCFCVKCFPYLSGPLPTFSATAALISLSGYLEEREGEREGERKGEREERREKKKTLWRWRRKLMPQVFGFFLLVLIFLMELATEWNIEKEIDR